MRDKLKSVEYFNNFIAEDLLRIKKFSDKLEREEVNRQMLFPDAFSTLQKVVYEENKVELLKKYLISEWYTEDCGCYGAHESRE